MSQVVLPYQQTSLWKRTLAEQASDEYAAQRARLRHAYEQFRRHVEPLANEIAISMPMFTDHSISHIDALWDTASLIIGDEYPVTPTEAFVLGGAFLLHDLGMGLASYPNRGVDLEATPEYLDYKEVLSASPGDLDADGIHQSALVNALRLRHARQAERLFEQEFSTSRSADKFYLLADPVLKSTYGKLIGRIARSHWLGVSDLPGLFPKVLGAVDDFPPNWQVDPLKVACILRVSDAAQIDSRRAPMLLHAFRSPRGASADHWAFQQQMSKPKLPDDRLEYTAFDSFSVHEASAWWLCYETVTMINSEIRSVDSVLADLGRPRFKARSVAGAEAPIRFAEYVPTESWTPIDASIRATDVRGIVKHLGGEALYGREPFVAVRELIANAADSTRARRIQYGGTDLAVWVQLLETEDGQWELVISDRGMGMSSDELVTNLTDFGASRWASQQQIEQYPRLLSGGFRPTGKFGIGFFAAFMIADRVQVKSLRYRPGTSATYILQFADGLNGRPLLRQADENEELTAGGTEIRLTLKNPPKSSNGLFQVTSSRYSVEELMKRSLRRECALIDVDILYKGPHDQDFARLITGDSWKTMSPSALFDLLYVSGVTYEDPERQAMYEAYRGAFIENLTDLLDDDGNIVGRAMLAAGLEEMVSLDLWWWPSPYALVFVGGLRADTIHDVMGAFVGDTLRADRNSAFPIASTSALRNWVRDQGERHLNATFATPRSRLGAGQLAMAVGEVITNLPCGLADLGEITPTTLLPWLREFEEVYMIPSWELHVFYTESGHFAFIDRVRGRQVQLPENALVIDLFPAWLFPEEVLKRPVDESFSSLDAAGETDWDPAAWWKIRAWGSARLVLEAASAAWGTDPVTLGMNTQPRTFESSGSDQRITVQCIDGSGEVKIEAYCIRRPGAGALQAQQTA